MDETDKKLLVNDLKKEMWQLLHEQSKFYELEGVESVNAAILNEKLFDISHALNELENSSK